MSSTPFFGVSHHPDGTYTDLLTKTTIDISEIKVKNMTPFYGRFIDKDGVEHDIRELSSGSGGEISDAPFDNQPYIRQNGSWKKLMPLLEEAIRAEIGVVLNGAY